jgi:hypothetical protein
MGIPSRHPEHEEEEEYDDALFYEDIQAPMFVDLTAPDAGRPTDDASWFCPPLDSSSNRSDSPFEIIGTDPSPGASVRATAGCDQNHEQVDPDALDRSFFMRVRCLFLAYRLASSLLRPGV